MVLGSTNTGVITEADKGCRPDDIAPYADHVLASFGLDRVLWGSDWPVVLLRADYESWLTAARRLVAEQHHAVVFGDNAARIYRLAPEGT